MPVLSSMSCHAHPRLSFGNSNRAVVPVGTHRCRSSRTYRLSFQSAQPRVFQSHHRAVVPARTCCRSSGTVLSSVAGRYVVPVGMHRAVVPVGTHRAVVPVTCCRSIGTSFQSACTERVLSFQWRCTHRAVVPVGMHRAVVPHVLSFQSAYAVVPVTCCRSSRHAPCCRSSRHGTVLSFQSARTVLSFQSAYAVVPVTCCRSSRHAPCCRSSRRTVVPVGTHRAVVPVGTHRAVVPVTLSFQSVRNAPCCRSSTPSVCRSGTHRAVVPVAPCCRSSRHAPCCRSSRQHRAVVPVIVVPVGTHRAVVPVGTHRAVVPGLCSSCRVCTHNPSSRHAP